jgi:hypothetical protein
MVLILSILIFISCIAVYTLYCWLADKKLKIRELEKEQEAYLEENPLLKDLWQK